MSELKDVITSYNSLSFSDRIVFYTTISNDITISDDTQVGPVISMANALKRYFTMLHAG